MLFEILDNRESVTMLVLGENGDGSFGLGLGGLGRFEGRLREVGVWLLIEMAGGDAGRGKLRGARLRVGLTSEVVGVVAGYRRGRGGRRGNGLLIVRSLSRKQSVGALDIKRDETTHRRVGKFLSLGFAIRFLER